MNTALSKTTWRESRRPATQPAPNVALSCWDIPADAVRVKLLSQVCLLLIESTGSKGKLFSCFTSLIQRLLDAQPTIFRSWQGLLVGFDSDGVHEHPSRDEVFKLYPKGTWFLADSQNAVPVTSGAPGTLECDHRFFIIFATSSPLNQYWSFLKYVGAIEIAMEPFRWEEIQFIA
jgi:hypothetical protein